AVLRRGACRRRAGARGRSLAGAAGPARAGTVVTHGDTAGRRPTDGRTVLALRRVPQLSPRPAGCDSGARTRRDAGAARIRRRDRRTRLRAERALPDGDGTLHPRE